MKKGDNVEYIGKSISGFINGNIYVVSSNYLGGTGLPCIYVEGFNSGHTEKSFKLQTNNIKGEDKMGKTVISADVKAEFGKEDGDTLINVSDHLNEGVINRILMKKYHKEIVTECNAIEKKRLEAESKD